MEQSYYVYGIFDPDSDRPFYIGKGHGKRAYDHLKRTCAPANNKKHRFIETIREKGKEPLVLILFNYLLEQDAYDLEELLIASFGRDGIDDGGILVNNLLQGRPPVMTEDVREKISQSRKGITFSQDHLEKLSRAKKGKSWEEIFGFEKAQELRKNRRAGRGPHKEETRCLISEQKKGKPGHRQTEETKIKISKSLRGIKRSDQHRKTLSELYQTAMTCPHCRHKGKGLAMKRWHFENCKERNNVED